MLRGKLPSPQKRSTKSANETTWSLLMRSTIYAFTAFLFSTTSPQIHAADALPGLLSLTLGSRFEAPECPKSDSGVQYPPLCAVHESTASWRDGPFADRYLIILDAERLPTWAGTFNVIVRDGVIVELTLTTRGATVQTEAYNAIRIRLGKPTSVSEKKWRHRSLGVVPSISAQWRKPSWQAGFEAVAGDLDMGLLTVSMPPEPKKPSPSL